MLPGKIKFALLFFFFASATHSQTGYEITKRMFAKTRQIKSLSFTMKKIERIKGVLTEQISFTKLTRQPFRVYSKQIFPKKGMEILYVEGSNNHKALINTNGFPWINLSLSPLGSTMRENQHHTILESGYDHVVSILEYLFEKYREETKAMVRLIGSNEWKGDSCWVVEINNPYFRYLKYTAQPGESILSIAQKMKLSEYMLLSKNKEVKDYNEVIGGRVIEIPNDYSPRIILFIDKKRMIPVMMQIYDDLGLYELYEYSGILIDPVVEPKEFTKDYKEYDF